MNVSKCCGAGVRVDSADEGTCCYVCEKCGRATDAVTRKPNPYTDEEIVALLRDGRANKAALLSLAWDHSGVSWRVLKDGKQWPSFVKRSEGVASIGYYLFMGFDLEATIPLPPKRITCTKCLGLGRIGGEDEKYCEPSSPCPMCDKDGLVDAPQEPLVITTEDGE